MQLVCLDIQVLGKNLHASSYTVCQTYILYTALAARIIICGAELSAFNLSIGSAKAARI